MSRLRPTKSRRSLEPRPLKQRQHKTVFLRVPTPAWTAVSTGQISEFRCATGNVSQASWQMPVPTLAIAYRIRPLEAQYDYRLMFLERVRREVLGAITDLGLQRAGYEGEDAFARFRREWMLHEKRRFDPLRPVFVYTVRPIEPGDLSSAGITLLGHLYGEYLEDAQERARTVQIERPLKPTRHRRVTLTARHG